jgi:hypothetical protein
MSAMGRISSDTNRTRKRGTSQSLRLSVLADASGLLMGVPKFASCKHFAFGDRIRGVWRSSLVAESRIMTRSLLVLLAVAIITPVALAQQLPPPQKPAGNETEWLLPSPSLVPPQNEPQQPAQNGRQVLPQNAPPQPPAGPPVGAQPVKKTSDQLNALYAARRRAQIDRKQAQIDRMNQFKAVRAAEEQKLYQDWHERYLADAPVRVEFYRAMTAAYQSQPAIPYYTTPYFYGAGPPVILPLVYAPVVSTPFYYGPATYGTFFSWGW